jgi:glycosyltransferase involved in cell wall biosynthesis
VSSCKAVEFAILMPVFNDFEVAGLCVQSIDEHLGGQGARVTVVILDDASTEPAEDALVSARLTSVAAVEVVRLRRNLGHQRAIAVGLAWAHDNLEVDAVVVMDADGQDRPEDIPRLLEAFRQGNGREVVFAARSQRRPEGWLFKLGYQAYRVLHLILVGISVRVGNFSLVPRPCLARLVAVSELWNHYAAAVFKSRIPYVEVRAQRRPRLLGSSRMDFPALLAHGLSAISVFSERAGARILTFLTVLSVALGGTIAAWVFAWLWPGLEVPMWATVTLGLAVVMFSQVTVVACGVLFFIMSSRDTQTFLPIRDYRHFVLDTARLYPSPTSHPDEPVSLPGQ